ncbi:MAG: murein biosynthesis integral membrane protein MurJ [Chloroflexota bacterium]
MTTIDTTPPPDDSEEKQKRMNNIARSTLMLMALFAIAKAISLGQTVIIAQFFGLGPEWDAYVTANRVPATIVDLISGGALGFAFIPVFSGFLARGDKVDGYRLASRLVNVVFTVALIISAVVYMFTPWLVANVIAPGFVENPQTFEQTVVMMRMLLLGTIIFSVSGIFSSILHSHNQFLLPAVAPIMYDLGILFGVVFLLEPFGVYGVAIGTVLGALGHLLIQVPGLIRNGAKWFPEFGIRDPMLWEVFRLMLPRVIGLFVFQFNFIFMTNIASRLGEGSVSAFDWGWRLMQIPQTLIGTAMGIVIFPTLAALSEVKDDFGKRNALSGALKFILILSLPSALGLILVGQPLLSLLERGAFDASATQLVYTTLSAFTLGIIVYSMLEVLARSFYADRDTWTPLYASLAGAAINVILALWLTGILTNESPPTENVMWLALSNSLGIAFQVLVLIVLRRRRWNGFNEKSILITTGKTIVASIVMGFAVVAVAEVFAMLGLQDRLLYTIAQLSVQVAVGGAVFLISTLLLGMDEVKDMIRLLLRRNKAKLETI